jgi:ATP-dependent 26S proteasome regulatory subunit
MSRSSNFIPSNDSYAVANDRDPGYKLDSDEEEHEKINNGNENSNSNDASDNKFDSNHFASIADSEADVDSNAILQLMNKDKAVYKAISQIAQNAMKEGACVRKSKKNNNVVRVNPKKNQSNKNVISIPLRLFKKWPLLEKQQKLVMYEPLLVNTKSCLDHCVIGLITLMKC